MNALDKRDFQAKSRKKKRERVLDFLSSSALKNYCASGVHWTKSSCEARVLQKFCRIWLFLPSFEPAPSSSDLVGFHLHWSSIITLEQILEIEVHEACSLIHRYRLKPVWPHRSAPLRAPPKVSGTVVGGISSVPTSDRCGHWSRDMHTAENRIAPEYV